MPQIKLRLQFVFLGVWLFWFGCGFSWGATAPIRLKKVVVFGDSLSDTGNTWALTRYLSGVGEKPWFYDPLYKTSWGWLPLRYFVGVLPPPAAYDRGRFSNGPLASELTMPMMGLDANDPNQFVNLAFGGSWTVSGNRFLGSWLAQWEDSSVSTMEWFGHIAGGLGKWVLPSVAEVVDWYLSQNRELDGDTMYVIASGSNDYQNQYWDVETIVASQVSFVERLVAAGARHIGWSTLPDLTMTPCFQGSGEVGRIRGYVKEHNLGIQVALRLLEQLHPEVKITFADGYTALQIFFDNAEYFGFKVKDRGCTNINIDGCSLQGGVSIQQGVFSVLNGSEMQVCDNPDEYFFWDAMHPSTRAYEHIASYLCVMAGMSGYWTDCRLPANFDQGKVEKLYDLIIEDAPQGVIPDKEQLRTLLRR